MAFVQSCFIKKNTPELRKKLEELGYRYSSTFDENAPYIWLGEGVIYDTFNIGITIIDIGEYFGPYGISCGDNEELFLALAALRDNSDKNQWFISDKTKQFYKCISDKIDFHEEGIANWLCCDSAEHFRKASVEEIIEHFKDK